MVQHSAIDHTGLPGVGGAAVAYDLERYTGGTISVTSTTDGAALSGPGSLVVAAASGDLLDIRVSMLTSSAGSGADLRIDVATIVSASPVNYVSSLSGTPDTVGVAGWFVPASTRLPITGSVLYVAQAGDISGGNVTLGLRAWCSAVSGRGILASSPDLLFQVINPGQ